MKVQDYLKTQRWVKGFESIKDGCCCLGSAIDRTSYLIEDLEQAAKHQSDLYRKVYYYIIEHYPNYTSKNGSTSTIVNWNDAPERTYEDVLKLVKDLDI